MKNLAKALLITLFYCGVNAQNCSTSNVKELVRNGDFEAGYLTASSDVTVHEFITGGDLDFYSDLGFAGNFPSSSCYYSLGDKYAIGKAEDFTCSGTDYLNTFPFGISYGGDANFSDHTPGLSGAGHAFLADVNALTSSAKHGGNPIVWEQALKVEPGVEYTFSAWAARYSLSTHTLLNIIAMPIVDGSDDVSGQINIVSGYTSGGLVEWGKLSGQFTTGTGVDSIYLRIEVGNPEAGGSGCDFVLDDISLINSCSVSEEINNDFLVSSDSLEICLFNGDSENVRVIDELGADVNAAINRNVYWYKGSGASQVLIDSITNNFQPFISTTGEYRMCIEEDGYACAVNYTFYAVEEDCGTSDDYCSESKPKELVRNGDFEAGYLVTDPIDSDKHLYTEGGELDFYTDATFAGTMPEDLESECGSFGGVLPTAKYYVGKAENFYCGIGYTNYLYPWFTLEGSANFEDHTSGKGGKGFAMLVDPWTPQVKSTNTILWEQKVAVEEAENYTFSVWAAMFERENPAKLELAVVPCEDNLPVEAEKAVVFIGASDSVVMQWTQLAGTWTTPTGVDSVFLRIEFDRASAIGGEFTIIDDISFTNTCENFEKEITNRFYLNHSEVEICAAGGQIPVQIYNENSSNYSPDSGSEIYWYEGSDDVQILLDSINDKTNPIFTSPGNFRVCIKDPVNGCVINENLDIVQALDLGTYDIELCNDDSELITTSVKTGSLSTTTPNWTWPSGKKQTTYEIVADEVGTYTVIVGTQTGYRCKASARFEVTSQIPSAKNDTVTYCTTAPDNIYVESNTGEEFIWAYDSNMTDVIDTAAAFWLPGAPSDTFPVYFKRLAQDELGVLNEDSNSFYTGGYSRFPATDYINVIKEDVVLKELYVKTQFWESGCDATAGAIRENYIVVDGPTYDSIPFNFECGGYTKVDVNVELLIGNYEIRSGLYTVVGSIESPQSISGYVNQSSSDNGGINKFYSKVKFTKANNCKAGSLLAAGEFCDFVSGVNEVAAQDFLVYPNPTTGILNFDKELKLVEVYSSNGQFIDSYSEVSQISTVDLMPGIYFVKSLGKVKSIVKK